ncbi:hypothetical protein FRB99_002525 [Tulasnella sp. 403]|nr:hypothetical protein FRB99_002525 [Tulasnella sp. 403]
MTSNIPVRPVSMNTVPAHAASPVSRIPAPVPPTTDETQTTLTSLPSTSASRVPNRNRQSLSLATVPLPRFQNEIDSVNRLTNGCKALLDSQPLSPFTTIITRMAGLFGFGAGSSTIEADAPPSYDDVIAEDAGLAKDGESLPSY